MGDVLKVHYADIGGGILLYEGAGVDLRAICRIHLTNPILMSCDKSLVTCNRCLKKLYEMEKE